MTLIDSHGIESSKKDYPETCKITCEFCGKWIAIAPYHFICNEDNDPVDEMICSECWKKL